jgi:hypothetical protein
MHLDASVVRWYGRYSDEIYSLHIALFRLCRGGSLRSYSSNQHDACVLLHVTSFCPSNYSPITVFFFGHYSHMLATLKKSEQNGRLYFWKSAQGTAKFWPLIRNSWPAAAKLVGYEKDIKGPSWPNLGYAKRNQSALKANSTVNNCPHWPQPGSGLAVLWPLGCKSVTQSLGRLLNQTCLQNS